MTIFKRDDLQGLTQSSAVPGLKKKETIFFNVKNKLLIHPDSMPTLVGRN